MIGVTPGRGGAVCSGNGVSLRAVTWHTPYSGYSTLSSPVLCQETIQQNTFLLLTISSLLTPDQNPIWVRMAADRWAAQWSKSH